MTLCYDKQGRPTGLDWTVINANHVPDPSVWRKAQDKPRDTKLPDETEAEIVRLHLRGVLAAEIARGLDISTATVGKVLDRRGVTQDRGRGTRQKTSDDLIAEVIRLYTEEKLGGTDIHRRTGVGIATIYKALRRNGIPTRRAA